LLSGDSLDNLTYSLVKHANFSFQDLLVMTFKERRAFYDMLEKELEKQKQEIEKARPSRAK